MARTGWRRCLPRAPPLEARGGGGKAGGGRGGARRAPCSRVLSHRSRDPSVCARGAGCREYDGRAPLLGGVRVRVGGPGRREVLAGGQPGSGADTRAHAPGGGFSGGCSLLCQTESGSVSPPSLTRPASPRGDCSSSAPPAPAPLRAAAAAAGPAEPLCGAARRGRRRRNHLTEARALDAPSARMRREVKAAAARLPPSAGEGGDGRGDRRGGRRTEARRGLEVPIRPRRHRTAPSGPGAREAFAVPGEPKLKEQNV